MSRVIDTTAALTTLSAVHTSRHHKYCLKTTMACRTSLSLVVVLAAMWQPSKQRSSA